MTLNILNDKKVNLDDTSDNPIINWLGEKNEMNHFFYTLYPEQKYIGSKNNRMVYRLNGKEVKLSEARNTKYKIEWKKVFEICTKLSDSK